MKTLYCNADVLLYREQGFYVLKNAYVGVENDRFCYVGTEKPESSYDRITDMRNKLIMPGLYNCHTHAPMVLLRGIGSGLPLDKWLFEAVFPIEDKLTPELISTGSDLAIAEMIAGGTVSFSDMYFFPEKTVESVLKSGMKANISRPVQAFRPGDPGALSRIRESVALFNSYHGAGSGRVLVDFCIHAEYTCNEETVAQYSALCTELHGNMHIHLSETEKEHEACKAKYGKTPARWFFDLGAFDSRAFAAHCVTLEEEDMQILKEKNVSIVHNPTSNLKLGSGFAPIPKYLDLGINVALGTDGAASNNNLNMFEEMHLAGIIHNGYERNATAISANTVLEMATVNGAALQGREQCGRIEVGCHADFIAVDLDRPHMTPQLDLPALLVYSAGAGDVCLTVCDGKELYKNGEFYTLDIEKTRFDLVHALKELYGD